MTDDKPISGVFRRASLRKVRWAHGGDVVLLDAGRLTQWFNTRQLAVLGFGCEIALTPGQASCLLRACPSVFLVLVDYDTIAGERSAIDELRDAAPRATIVGTSLGDRCGDFEAIGVWHYLEQPWTPEDLRHLLSKSVPREHRL